MKIQSIRRGAHCIAVAESHAPVLNGTQAAVDLIMQAKYDADSGCLILPKSAVDDRFFILSSGLAGEILQKFVNYHAKLAVYGDFSGYTSKPLHDFIYECNEGQDFFFVSTLEEAIERLVHAAD